MDARHVEQAERRLRGLEERGLGELAVGAAGLAGALVATRLAPPLALPLLIAGVTLALVGVAALVRRAFLIDDLSADPDAYAIAGVRLRALQAASPLHRRRAAESLRLVLRTPPAGVASRIDAERPLLEELADELEHTEAPLDPRRAVELERLLDGRLASPLYDAEVPAVDLHAALIRILAGFEQRRAA